MKKLLLLALPLMLIYACEKEGIAPAAVDQLEETSSSSAWIINPNSEASGWELITLEEPVTSSLVMRGNSAHTHGDYTAFGTFHLIFNGTQNNGGAHGSATLMRSSGPFELHVVMETVSVVVQNENKAIYGGIITEVVANNFPPPPPPRPCPTFPNCPPPPSCSPYDLGSYVYFQVIDNGQGNNAPADQYRGLIATCNEFPNGAAGFPWFIFRASDVEEGDNIKVNN